MTSWKTALICLLGITTVGCNLGFSPTDSGNRSVRTLSATIDGTSINFGSPQADLALGDLSFFADSRARTFDGSVSLHLGGLPFGPGTYTVGSVSGSQWATVRRHQTGGSDHIWRTGTGTVTLTAFDTYRAAGTFSFVAEADPSTGATGTVTVTDGRFDIAF